MSEWALRTACRNSAIAPSISWRAQNKDPRLYRTRAYPRDQFRIAVNSPQLSLAVVHSHGRIADFVEKGDEVDQDPPENAPFRLQRTQSLHFLRSEGRRTCRPTETGRRWRRDEQRPIALGSATPGRGRGTRTIPCVSCPKRTTHTKLVGGTAIPLRLGAKSTLACRHGVSGV